MSEDPGAESADMVAFGSAELGAYTASLIQAMEREGTKIKRDEWEFAGGLGIRINYAHREQRIHLLHNRNSVEVVSVNIDATAPEFPTLDDLLNRLRNTVAARKVDAAIHRTGEEPQ